MAAATPAGVVEREPALPQTTIDTGHADMIVRSSFEVLDVSSGLCLLVVLKLTSVLLLLSSFMMRTRCGRLEL